MPYGVPAGIAAFGGGLSSSASTGPGNPFTNVFGSVAGGYQPDRSFEKVVQVLELERALSAEKRRRETARKQAEDAAEVRALMGSRELEELFDLDQKTAIARRFPKAQDPTSLQRNLQAGGLQPGTPEFQQAMMQAVNKPQVSIKQEGPIPSGRRAIRDVQGNVVRYELIPGAPTTEAGNKSALYSAQAADSAAVVDSLEAAGYNPGTIWESAKNMTRWSQSSEGKAYNDAADRWVESMGRARSGAEIKDSEFERLRNLYFPVLHDTEVEIAAKAAARKVAEQQMAVSGAEALASAQATVPSIPDIPPEQLQQMSIEELLQLKQEMMNAAQP